MSESSFSNLKMLIHYQPNLYDIKENIYLISNITLR